MDLTAEEKKQMMDEFGNFLGRLSFSVMCFFIVGQVVWSAHLNLAQKFGNMAKWLMVPLEVYLFLVISCTISLAVLQLCDSVRNSELLNNED